ADAIDATARRPLLREGFFHARRMLGADREGRQRRSEGGRHESRSTTERRMGRRVWRIGTMSDEVVTDGPADIPPYRYTAAMAGEIEACWQDYWQEQGTFNAPNPTGPLSDPTHPRSGAPKLYVMDMFPYPSGAGLHVGHPLGYIGTDCYTRYFRMAGYNV